MAASIESQSEHPIAQGIVAKAEEQEIKWPKPKDFQAIAGKGAKAEVEGRSVKVVSPGYLKEHDLQADHDEVRKLAEQGKTVVYVLIDDEVAGAIALGDVVREGVARGDRPAQGDGTSR